MNSFEQHAPPNIGLHLLVDFYQCSAGMTDVEAVEKAIVEAIDAIGATLLSLRVHSFSNGHQSAGFTAVAILSESHLAIHTWPENHYVGIDIFTCGQNVQPERGLNTLKDFFQPNRIRTQLIERPHATNHLGLPVERKISLKEEESD